MQKKINILLIFLYCFFFILPSVLAQDASPAKPLLNNGEKWRIGFVEGGPYYNYQMLLTAMIKSLMASGWIEQAPLPEPKDETETKTLWDFLTTDIKSGYLEFPSDAYWTCDWDDKKRAALKPVIIQRLKNDKDIDLMLAFGTWSGQDLVNNDHNTPTLVISASNAVRAGIIKSAEDSGFDHVVAFIDPKRSERQLRLFHEITGFTRLGIAYEDDLDGRSYAAIDDVINLSEELGFQVIECKLLRKTAEVEHQERTLINCYQQLAPKIDAMYLTDEVGLSNNSITQLLHPLFEHKVLMFSQTKSNLVKYGILMGTARVDFKADAEFYALTFGKILNGAKPRDLPQIFESPLDLVVNLESAKKIGYRIPIDVLAGASKIHESIEVPDPGK